MNFGGIFLGFLVFLFGGAFMGRAPKPSDFAYQKLIEFPILICFTVYSASLGNKLWRFPFPLSEETKSKIREKMERKSIDGPECKNCKGNRFVRKISKPQIVASFLFIPFSFLILFKKYFYCIDCGQKMPRSANTNK